MQNSMLAYPNPAPRLHPAAVRPQCAGGTSIEDLAEKYPEKIIKIPIDVFEGITDEQVRPF